MQDLLTCAQIDCYMQELCEVCFFSLNSLQKWSFTQKQSIAIVL